jgi:DnaJ-class molecular chaperone
MIQMGCNACGGAGTTIKHLCSNCNGRGTITK